MNTADVIPRVRDFIVERFLPGENPANLTDTTPLLSGGILDSLGTLELVGFLEKTWGIELQAHEVDRTRLDTLERIAQLVASKKAGS